MKRRKFWLVAIIVFATSVLVLWLRSRPPAKVVSIGTITLPKPIDQHWLSKQGKGGLPHRKRQYSKVDQCSIQGEAELGYLILAAVMPT